MSQQKKPPVFLFFLKQLQPKQRKMIPQIAKVLFGPVLQKGFLAWIVSLIEPHFSDCCWDPVFQGVWVHIFVYLLYWCVYLIAPSQSTIFVAYNGRNSLCGHRGEVMWNHHHSYDLSDQLSIQDHSANLDASEWFRTHAMPIFAWFANWT